MADQHRFAYQDDEDDFLRTIADAQRRLILEIETAQRAGRLELARERRRQLAAVLQVLDELGVRAERQARKIVKDAFDESAKDTGARIGAHITFNETAFNSVAKEAVQAFQDAMSGRIKDAFATVGRQIEDAFAKAGRRAALVNLLGAGGSPAKASADMAGQLREKGITSFVDRAGRDWKLEDYTRMATRTTTREAVVEGAKARMLAQGVTVARVSVSPKPCPICLEWQGRLVSLDAKTSEYKGEPVATLDAMPHGGPPFHPNCTHTLLPEVDLTAGSGYDGKRHGDDKEIPPTRHQRSPGDPGNAGAPGYPDLARLQQINKGVHQDAGQPERFALDQRAPLKSALDRAIKEYDGTPEGVARTAADLVHGIASAQGFRDGNRRTAILATLQFLRDNDLADLITTPDHMLARHLNRLVEDQGAGRPPRVTAQTFMDLFLRRLKRRGI